MNRIDPRARGVFVLIVLSLVAAWLERRPPAWLDADPLLQPFGRTGPADRAAQLDSILHPPPPPPREPAVVDPNRATREEWIALPGVGPVTADRIAAFLEGGRRFRRAEDLGQVRGIGPVRVERLRPWLSFPAVPRDSLSSVTADSMAKRGK
jgi:hypothetical protein